MVHYGPAKGCQRCKERHVKCDEERPSCQQCTRLDYKCPGYRHALDIVLRNQTRSVTQRNDRSKVKEQANEAEGAALSPSCQVHVPTSLDHGWQIRSLAFLFSAHVGAMRDWRTSYGHLDVLQPLFARARAQSALTLAISWLAIMLLGIHDRGRPYPDESRLLLAAIRKIRDAISNPLGCVADETLAAVHVIAYGEFLRSTTYGVKTCWMTHQAGLQAIIRKRGSTNFQGQVPLAMYSAARHNATNLVLSGIQKPEDWDLWNSYPLECGFRNPYTPATALDTFAVELIRLENITSNQPCVIEEKLRNEVSQLQEGLLWWISTVPTDWMNGEAMPSSSPEVIYLMNDFHLVQLGLSHLSKQLKIGTANFTNADFVIERQCIDHVLESKQALLSAPLFPSISYLNDRVHQGSATCANCHRGRLYRQSLGKLRRIIRKGLQEVIPDSLGIRFYYSHVLDLAEQERLSAHSCTSTDTREA